MTEALMLAESAAEQGEVPIGAIVVRDNEIIGRGWNQNIGLHDPSAHAEIMAMRDAGQNLGNHRAAGGRFDLLGDPAHNHVVQVDGGCCAQESSHMLKTFFRKRR